MSDSQAAPVSPFTISLTLSSSDFTADTGNVWMEKMLEDVDGDVVLSSLAELRI